MRCAACPHPARSRCLGERRPDLCGRPGWGDYLARQPDDFRERALANPPADPRPVAEAVRLSLLRNACPAAAKAEDCGCSDDRLCARRDGARVDRETCFRCIQADEDRR